MIQPLEKIYVVVCDGISDVGKGWLTAAVSGLDPQHTMPIKIDPLLTLSFPQHLGIPIQELCAPADVEAFIQQGRASSKAFKISEDFGTYRDVGVSVYPECNIVAGDLINRFLNSPNVEIRPGEIKKRTFSDLSHFLAREITAIVRAHSPKTLIVEVGGTIEDQESVYIPGAFRFLRDSEFLGLVPEILLLTFFEYAESYDTGKYRLKTQHIRRGIIRASKTYYQLPLKACFVRRRNVPDTVPDEVLLKDLQNVAYETQVSPDRIVFLPNVSRGAVRDRLRELTEVICTTGLFS